MPERAATDFSGKIALVIDGAQGVGKVVASLLAERGAQVIISCFHSHDAANQTIAELRGRGLLAELFHASVAEADGVRKLFSHIANRHGRLDVLIHNATAGPLGGLGELTEADWARTFERTFYSALRCLEASVPLMSERGGAIVNLSSIGTQFVPDGYAAVSIATSAVEALTRNAAVAYASSGIRVNAASAAVLLNGTDLPALRGNDEPIRDAEADLAELVLFLASDAARRVTGQVLMADGGRSLGAALFTPLTHDRPAVQDGATTTAATTPAPAPAVTADRPVAGSDRIVAVVGMGVALPRASSPDELWTLLRQGEDVFADNRDRFDFDDIFDDDPSAEDKTYSRGFGYLSELRPHPRLRGEIKRGEAPAELTALWLRHCLLQTLDTTTVRADDRCSFTIGYAPHGSAGLEDALVLDVTKRRLMSPSAPDGRADGAAEALRHLLERRFRHGGPRPWECLPHRVGQLAMRGLLPDDTDLAMIDAACASGMYAIEAGLRSVLSGDATVAFCGGAFSVAARECVMMAKSRGLSRSGHVHALDSRADGTIWGDGASVVALKTLDRAIADGDPVLGIVSGMGTSADGRGKAIYAPDSRGQRLAVQRARDDASVRAADIDWIIAHATGTPVGDGVELQTLAAMADPQRPQLVTANKSLVGHTSWAAGVVSLLHGLLALRNEVVPRQQRFQTPAAALNTDLLEVPVEDKPWPAASEQARTVGISSFGFGGANAHLILTDTPSPQKVLPPTAVDDVVLVAWDVLLPETTDREAIFSALQSRQWTAPRSFGDTYPPPDIAVTGLPPVSARRVDRCQLMILQVLHQIIERDGLPWRGLEDTTGIFAAHSGPSRTATAYALRCNLPAVRRMLTEACGAEADAAHLTEAFDRFADHVRASVPPSTEDSLPGMMPNCIASRASKKFDLHGMAMTVEQGSDSALFALRYAMRELQAGRLDMAVVCGLNGNTSPEFVELMYPESTSSRVSEIAEGAFALVLSRRGVATDRGLPVLARLSAERLSEQSAAHTVQCGPVHGRTFLGGDGVVAVLGALIEDSPDVLVMPAAQHAQFGVRVQSDVTVRSDVTELAEDQIGRYTTAFRPVPSLAERKQVAPLPNGCLVLADTAVAAAQNTTCLTLTDIAAANSRDVADLTPDMLARAVDALPADIHDIRVVVAAGTVPDLDSGAVPYPILRLHELCFAALRRFAASLDSGRSFAVLTLGGLSGDWQNPYAALFAAMVMTLRQENPRCRSGVILTSGSDLTTGLDCLATELAAGLPAPIVGYRHGRRLLPHVHETRGPARNRLPDAPVILAVGGARGITAESVLTIAAVRPGAHVWLIGSNPLVGKGFEGEETSLDDIAEQVGQGQAAYIRAWRANPSASVVELRRRFDRLSQALESHKVLQRLRERLPSANVHYLRCDIADPDDVRDAVEAVLDAEGRIDLLLNGAGLNRRAPIAIKTGKDFREVRDVRVLGYLNLRQALREHPPGLWCDYGSVLGLLGQHGEVDYTSAAAFVNAAAEFADDDHSHSRFCIAWTLWRDAGFAADKATQELMAAAGEFTAVPTLAAGRLLLDELDGWHPTASQVLHFGDRELRTVAERLPGCFDEPEHESAAPRRLLFLDPASDRVGPGEWRISLDLESYPFLGAHSVNGVVALPGAFAVGIAVEAAVAVAPDARPRAVEDAVFSTRILLRPGRPTVIQVRTEQTGPERVIVRGLIDIHAPNGTLLRSGVECFQATVLLGDSTVDLTYVDCPPQTDVAFDISGNGESALEVGEPFPVLMNPRVGQGWSEAVVPLPVPGGAIPDRGLVPALLIDAVLRAGLLRATPDGEPLLGVPTRIGRIDVADLGSDTAIGAQHPSVAVCVARTVAGDGSCRIDTAWALAGGRTVLRLADAVFTPLAVQPKPSARNEVPTIAIVGMGLAMPQVDSPDDLWKLLANREPVYRVHSGDSRLSDVYDNDPDAADSCISQTFGTLAGLNPHPRLYQEMQDGTAPESSAAQSLRHSIFQALDTTTVRQGDRCCFMTAMAPNSLVDFEAAIVSDSAAQRLGQSIFGSATDGPSQVRRLVADRFGGAGADPRQCLPGAIARAAIAGILPDETEVTVLDAACTGSSYAVDAGLRSLICGDADVAVCGGVFEVTPTGYVLMSRTGVLSATGEVRAFDQAGGGSLFCDTAAVVTLKTMERAVADNDQVLAVIAGIGTSSDGRGKAMYTPDPAGQQLAVRRAMAVEATGDEHIDWVVAHGIGMPVGDSTELGVIHAAVGECLVTSYKSLTGHPSCTSGAVGIINAILGLRHAVVPQQALFDALPAQVADKVDGLRIPTMDTPFPRPDGTARRIGVSSFGFGGTNSHVIVADPPADGRSFGLRITEPDGDEMVLVGWGAHLPGEPDHHEVMRQLRQGALTTPLGFGEPFPLPAAADVGMPPAALRRAGRYQPIALMACDDMRQNYGAIWDGLADETGVFTGLYGPTDVVIANMLRSSRRAVETALGRSARVNPAAASKAFAEYSRQIDDLVPTVSEDSIIGYLTNCIPGRVAKRLGLRGLTTSVEQGPDSTLSALRLATRALRTHEIELALICGIGGNPSAEFLRDLDHDSPHIAEGAFALAVTTPRVAAAHRMTVLASLRPYRSDGYLPAIDPQTDRTYLGADSAVALLRALHHPAPQVLVMPQTSGHSPPIHVVKSTRTTTSNGAQQ
jgi:acyl transferase domain-containing protein/NAD(P)-dependent dehydrogenase (short-subunit alcohol dehydrogenase family)